VLVKLDFSNAFNSIHRLQMLHSVHSRIPELYAFCLSAYSQPSLLFFGPYIVTSQEGAQQGEPIGALLFCNTVQPLISSLQAELNLGYLDDVTLGGQVQMVVSDVAEIVRARSDLGLNVDKCELIAQKVGEGERRHTSHSKTTDCSFRLALGHSSSVTYKSRDK